jgi:hypothetical protein
MYGIKRINKKALLSDLVYLPKAQKTITRRLGPAASGRFTIKIVWSVEWFSDVEITSPIADMLRTISGTMNDIQNVLIGASNGIDVKDEQTGLYEYVSTVDETPTDIKQFINVMSFAGTVGDLKEMLKARFIANSIEAEQMTAHLRTWRAEVYDTFNGAKFNFDNGFLSQSDDIMQITKFSNVDINAPSHSGDYSCAVRFITKHIPALADQIRKMDTPQGIQICDILDFAKKYNIRMNMYNEQGTLLKVVSNCSNMDKH